MILPNTIQNTTLWARIFESNPRIEKRLVFFRIGACPLLALLAFLSRSRLPYWEPIVFGLFFLLVANLVLLKMWRERWYLTFAVIGTLLDTILLLLLSNIAIRASAREVTTSEMWLIYPLVILMAAYRFRWVASIVYTLILSGWYAVHVLLYFPAGARAYIELPIRVGFYLIMGAVAILMTQAWRQEVADYKLRRDLLSNNEAKVVSNISIGDH